LTRGPNATLGGGLFQLFDGAGTLVFQSAGLDRHRITTTPPPASGDSVFYREAGPAGWPVRLASQRVTIGGRPVTIEVGEPLRSYRASLGDYGRLLLLSIPALVLVASAVGFWMSGRALAPVDRIIAGAEAIGAHSLSERLSVPAARDELRRLSETLNAMLERIERSVARVTQFTADASHELRAPLSLIQAAAEHALRRERGREELVDALETVLRETKRTAGLVDDLLIMARADAGGGQVEDEPIGVAAVLREAADRVRPLAAAKGIALVTEIDDSGVDVMGDPALLHRLALIVLDNAIKYTPEGGWVRLALTARPGAACIEVADNGVGILASDLPLVFDRFWRADKARSRAAGGAGLGLSIAKWIVDRHGGELSVESEPGMGSTFRATLPASFRRS
jgi:heavy metal sensor kinase